MNYQHPSRGKLHLRRAILFLTAAFLLPLWFTVAPLAGWADERAEQIITIGAQEVINEDLYLAGETITINGTVNGDAVVAARQITLNGTVTGDLIAAGQSIIVNGTVQDDIRMAGQVLLVGEGARISDGVMAAGYSLETKAGSTIGGNLHFFGGQALLAGTVQKNVRAAAGALQIAGKVNGNLNLAVGNGGVSVSPFLPKSPAIPQIPPGLTLTSSTQVGGDLTYRSLAPANMATGATVSGRVVQEAIPVPPEQRPKLAHQLLLQGQRLVTLVLVGWLLLKLLPGWLPTLSTTVATQPLPAFGWGVVTVAGVVAGTIALSLLTVLLLAISGLLLPPLVLPVLGVGLLALLALLIGFGIVTNFVPPLILSFLGGQWLVARLQPGRSLNPLVALIAGLVVFVVLTALPVVGGFFNAIAVFLGLGALWLGWRSGDRGGTTSESPLAAV